MPTKAHSATPITPTLAEQLARRALPKPWYIQLWRFVIVWLINALALQVAILFMPSLQTEAGFFGLFMFSVLVASLNAFIRPIFVKLTLPITMMTLGVITFFINGLIFILADWLLPLINFDSLGQAVWLSIFVALLTWVTHVLLSIDDSDSYYYSVVKRMGTKRTAQGSKTTTEKPGVLYLEIDGLAEPILREAVAKGYMPTVQQLLAESHALTEWQTDLPTQTCSSQMGILHGNNWNAIGFRWYDRAKKLAITASNPKFVAELEASVANGKGLLAKNGASIGNMFSGEAELTAFTTSASADKKKTNTYDPLSYYFINPYNYLHTVATVFWEVVLEFRDARLQVKENRSPRVERGGVSALLRSIMCVVVPDMAVQTAIGELFAGRDAIYLTYAGYDEMSHLAGLDRPETLRSLRRVDQAIFYLLLAIKESPRPYQLILLSDHGQSMGWTFDHLYHQSIGDVVKAGCTPTADVREMAGVDEVGIVIGDILTDVRKSLQSKFSLNLFRKIVTKLSPGSQPDDVLVIDTKTAVQAKLTGFADIPEILIQVGGNMVMIYFTTADKRIDLHEITARQPKLIPTLLAHPGVGFVMVKTAHGPVAFGRSGRTYVDWNGTGTTRVIGQDPLTPFGPDAAMHIRRVAAFDTCPDILINSAYDPIKQEIIGFEPQCGAHGALGGPQNHPFLLYPKELKLSTRKIVGAEQVYTQLKRWQSA